METGAITSHIDVAQVVLYAFWIFFAGLVYYLQRESRREGYPLVSEIDGAPIDHGAIWVPTPKTYLLPDGSTVTVPRAEKDAQPPRLTPMPGSNGSAYSPSGDALMDGVGPGAYALRANTPEVTYEGDVRIVPLRSAPSYSLEERDPDPRGMTVLGADREVAGEVVDVWLDRADNHARYFEVELALVASRPVRGLDADGEPAALSPSRVLLPVNFSQINSRSRLITVEAILASQFAGVPTTTYPDIVTINEEERICAYYGGGYLYATPGRQESWL
jgi:photosynthetic reaction center H subunit